MSGLADALLEGQPGGGCRLAYGVVVTVTPLTVTVGASSVATTATALDSYTPTIGDYVAVLVQGADRLVIGSIT